jgi:hypothetical protein
MPPHTTDGPEVQRRVVGQVLARRRATSPTVLYPLIGAPQDVVDAAIVELAARRVIHRGTDGSLRATSALLHLDALKMLDV